MFKMIGRGVIAGITVAAMVFGLGIYPTAVTMAQEAMAQPVPTSPGLGGLLFANTVPYVVELLISGFFAVAVWLARQVNAKWKIDAEAKIREIEEKHRGALHSAVYTIISNIIAKGQLTAVKVEADSPVMDEVATYLGRSVPEAIERFSPSREVLSQIATKAAVELSAKISPPGAVAAAELLGSAFQMVQPNLK